MIELRCIMNNLLNFRRFALSSLCFLLGTSVGFPGEDVEQSGSENTADVSSAEFMNDALKRERIWTSAEVEWRNLAQQSQSDVTLWEETVNKLQSLIESVERPSDRDKFWARAHESLADIAREAPWVREVLSEVNSDAYYRIALDWLAGSTDVDWARTRYLGLVKKLTIDQQTNRGRYYLYYDQSQNLGGSVEMLENAVALAKNDEELSWTRYALAAALGTRGVDQPWRHKRTLLAFEAAVEDRNPKTNDWLDEALYQFGNWLEQMGELTVADNGDWGVAPDFEAAMQVYRDYLRLFDKGDAAYYDAVKNKMDQWIRKEVQVQVGSVFLPGSQIEFALNYRNQSRIQLELYPVSLNGRVDLSPDNTSGYEWVSKIDVAGIEAIRSWDFEPQPKFRKPYQYYGKTLRLSDPGDLKPGAYVLQASAGGVSDRALVIVSDAVVLVKSVGQTGRVFVADSGSGAPLANSKVVFWESYRERQPRVGRRGYENITRWNKHESTTDKEGMAGFVLTHPLEYRDYLVTVETKQGPAFCLGSAPRSAVTSAEQSLNWKVYAWTDRPVYRPGDNIQWKLIARQSIEETYQTPQGQAVVMEVLNPRGEVVYESTNTLNAFGSAWGELVLNEDVPLGMYNAQFYLPGKDDSENKQTIGYAQIFRLEEYRAPEFQVTVQTPKDENGAAKAFRVGETIEASVEAQYYSGAPVVEAMVEVIVTRNRFNRVWPEPREFPWYYDRNDYDMGSHGFGARRSDMRYPGGDSEEEVLHENFQTDAAGRVTFSIPTDLTDDTDWEYSIEARVTDASRREVVGTGVVRATRSLYDIRLSSKRRALQPGQKAEVSIIAKDANDQPQQVDGQVYLNRLVWEEVWIAPDERLVMGDELQRLRDRYEVFPPKPERPDQKPWKLRSQGYRSENLTTQELSTGADGEAVFEFKPTQEGYYEVVYLSRDRDDLPVRGETHLWVANPESKSMGYVTNDIEIIMDPDSVRVGQTAPVLIATPTSGCYVWFTLETGTLLESRLIQMKGTTQLIQLPIVDRHVPNFQIHVATIRDQRLYSDTTEVIAPPTRQFLTVHVELDQEAYEPGAKGKATIQTLDHSGVPVPTEIALSSIDASVLAIQSELQEDIRQFFYGEKRSHSVSTDVSFNDLPYVKLLEPAEDYDESGNGLRAGMGGGRAAGSVDLFYSGLRPKSMTLARGAETRMMAMDAAMPVMSEMAMEAPMALGDSLQTGQGDPAVRIRSNFSNTAVWIPDAVTDKNGKVTVDWQLPDSLTRWQTKAWAVSSASQFGWGQAESVTRQPLMVRLQAPRFAVAGDLIRVTAVIQNQSDVDLKVASSLSGTVNGETQLPINDFDPQSIPAGGETRLDWDLDLVQAGELKLVVQTRSVGGSVSYSDGMEKTLPVYPHGIEQWIGASGAIPSDLKSAVLTFQVPKERRKETSQLLINAQPSLAGSVLDAMPYLFDYPYGCIEQTLSRFVPAVTVRKVLVEQGIDPVTLDKQWFGGLEPDFISKTQSNKARPYSELDDVIDEGLAAALDAQKDDGSWGWWKGGSSDDYMTAYALWSLSLARQAGVEIPASALAKAAKYLELSLVDWERQPDMSVWILHALVEYGGSLSTFGATSERIVRTVDLIWEQKDRLNPYSRALAILAFHGLGKSDLVDVLISDVALGSFSDDGSGTSRISSGANGRVTNSAKAATVHWGSVSGYYRWSQGAVESTAFMLRALLRVQPNHPSVEPAMRWLAINRRGAHWSNTRDTAIAALALSDYLKTNGGLRNDSSFEVWWNGEKLAEHSFDQNGLGSLAQPFALNLEGDVILDGSNRLEIRRTSNGSPVYFSAYLEYFSEEEPIPASGVGLFAERRFGRIRQVPTLLKGYRPIKTLFEDGGSARSSERMEVVLWVEAKQDSEYLMVEDWKAAGMESTTQKSGAGIRARKLTDAALKAYRESEDLFFERPVAIPYTGQTVSVYQEMRDNRTAFFIDKLPEGVWEIRYETRLEAPGSYHVLPTRVEAMYVPELRGSGAENRMEILERPEL